jgi:hypothetical protein
MLSVKQMSKENNYLMPKSEKPVIANALKVLRIATGEEEGVIYLLKWAEKFLGCCTALPVRSLKQRQPIELGCTVPGMSIFSDTNHGDP